MDMSDISSIINLIIVVVCWVSLLLFDFADFVYSVMSFFDRMRDTIRKRWSELKLKYFGSMPEV